jgi:cytidylate kinase
MTPTPTTTAPPRLLTISATYGAGGPVAAPLLARRLGLPFVDRLLHPGAASAPPSQEQASDEELDEEPRSSLLESLALLGTTWNIPVPRDLEDLPERLRAANKTTIRELIDTGGAVILGRAAAVVLGKHPTAFHVRLDGPPDRRARRGAAWEGIDLDIARARLEHTDASRSHYMRRLYNRDPADPSLYHLILDATVMTTDPVVELIAAAAQAAWSHDDANLQRDVNVARTRLAELPPN